jgi:hypothetical protein
MPLTAELIREKPAKMRRRQPGGVPAGQTELWASVFRLAIPLLIAGFLLFAHGCHGDEDNELLAIVGTVMGGGE